MAIHSATRDNFDAGVRHGPIGANEVNGIRPPGSENDRRVGIRNLKRSANVLVSFFKKISLHEKLHSGGQSIEL